MFNQYFLKYWKDSTTMDFKVNFLKLACALQLFICLLTALYFLAGLNNVQSEYIPIVFASLFINA